MMIRYRTEGEIIMETELYNRMRRNNLTPNSVTDSRIRKSILVCEALVFINSLWKPPTPYLSAAS